MFGRYQLVVCKSQLPLVLVVVCTGSGVRKCFRRCTMYKVSFTLKSVVNTSGISRSIEIQADSQRVRTVLDG